MLASAMQAKHLLWTCIALFFIRVVGQIEVLLVAPPWLPPMSAWYSGLLPYPMLLPLQIALLMLMCTIAIRKSAAVSTARIAHSGGASILRALAILYFAVMVARLAWCVHRNGSDYYLHGAIPIAFHWVLALFVLALLRHREPADCGTHHASVRLLRIRSVTTQPKS
jgi:hypothetical protein